METVLIDCPPNRDPDDFFEEVYRAAQDEGVYAHRRCGLTYVTGNIARCMAVKLKAM